MSSLIMLCLKLSCYIIIIMQLASSARVPVILDAGGVDKPLAHDLLSNVSVLSPNETELERLTGMPTRSEKQCEAAAEALVHQGVDKVLVKMGAKGSMLVDIYGNIIRQKAAPVLHVIDTTGAGDCFTGAYAVGILEGKSDAKAMEFASTAAALCIQKQGAIPSLPTREEVENEMAHRASGGHEGGGSAGGLGSPKAMKSPTRDGPKQTFW